MTVARHSYWQSDGHETHRPLVDTASGDAPPHGGHSVTRPTAAWWTQSTAVVTRWPHTTAKKGRMTGSDCATARRRRVLDDVAVMMGLAWRQQGGEGSSTTVFGGSDSALDVVGSKYSSFSSMSTHVWNDVAAVIWPSWLDAIASGRTSATFVIDCDRAAADGRNSISGRRSLCVGSCWLDELGRPVSERR